MPTSPWRKSRIRLGPGAVEFRTLNGMAMGKRPAARQASPMWVDTADLPTNDGHPYFERLNRVLADSGFDAFVEELCAAFYADRLGRPSLRPGQYFRMLFIGYFEGLSSERGIAWRVADSLSLRSFLDRSERRPRHRAQAPAVEYSGSGVGVAVVGADGVTTSRSTLPRQRCRYPNDAAAVRPCRNG